jgi:hypothetical protein
MTRKPFVGTMSYRFWLLWYRVYIGVEQWWRCRKADRA